MSSQLSSVRWALIAAAPLALLGCNSGENPSTTERQAAQTSVATMVAQETRPAAASSAADLFAYATSAEVIGLNPAFLEKKLGPAKVRTAAGETGDWTFEIGECQVDYAVRDGVEVRSFTVRLDQPCTPSLRNVQGASGLRIAPDLRFGSVGKAVAGSWRASCLRSCGNAADPSLYYFHGGSRSSQFLEVQFEAVLAGGPALEAGDAWEAAIVTELGLSDDDFVLPDESTACGTVAQKAAAEALRDVPVEAISVGYDLDPAEGVKCA